MAKPIDITGESYGRLVAVSRVENKGRRTFWLFKCSCGNYKNIELYSVRSGSVNSCGCIQIENLIKRSLKHGHGSGYKKTREYRAWVHAKGRCYCITDHKYKDYGARGISMCNEWVNNFLAFYNYLGDCPKGYSLDRINVDGNYQPGNCRWATGKTQSRNRRKTLYATFDGKTKPLIEWCEDLGLNYKAVWHRMKVKNLSFKEAIYV